LGTFFLSFGIFLEYKNPPKKLNKNRINNKAFAIYNYMLSALLNGVKRQRAYQRLRKEYMEFMNKIII